jgi:hypothetical protein
LALNLTRAKMPPPTPQLRSIKAPQPASAINPTLTPELAGAFFLSDGGAFAELSSSSTRTGVRGAAVGLPPACEPRGTAGLSAELDAAAPAAGTLLTF